MPTSLRPHALPYAGLTVLVALALAGCGGSSSTTTGPAPVGGSTPAPSGTAGAGNGQGQRQPGTTGLIAAVNGSTMQVQTRTDQTAVTWSDTTEFTKQVVATLADVTTGSCVTVLEPQSAGSATATPGTTAAAPTTVSAATVQVRPASNGQCTGGFGAGFGGGGGGAGAPTGAPTRTGTRTAGPDGAGGGFGRRATNGLVTAVSGSTITVQETMRGGAGAGGASTGTVTTDGSTAGSGGTAEGTTQIVTVTTTGSTAYLAEKPASASDVVVGECATATGKADDTGAVAATAVALRPAANGSCTAGGTGRPTGAGSATTGSANG